MAGRGRPRKTEQPTEVPKQKRGNGSHPIRSTPLTANQMAMYKMFFWSTKVDMQDPEAKELIERTRQFMEAVETLQITPTLSEYAFAIQYTSEWIRRALDGQFKLSDMSREVLERVKRWLESSLVQTGFNNPLQQALVIFLLKNNHNFRDNVDVSVTTDNSLLSDRRSSSEIMRKYVTASVIDDTKTIEQKDIIDVDCNVIEDKQKVLETVSKEIPG